jgi:hypothetical protein
VRTDIDILFGEAEKQLQCPFKVRMTKQFLLMASFEQMLNRVLDVTMTCTACTAGPRLNQRSGIFTSGRHGPNIYEDTKP